MSALSVGLDILTQFQESILAQYDSDVESLWLSEAIWRNDGVWILLDMVSDDVKSMASIRKRMVKRCVILSF